MASDDEFEVDLGRIEQIIAGASGACSADAVNALIKFFIFHEEMTVEDN